MKRIPVILTLLLLCVLLLTACTRENPPETHIVHDGKLWKVPAETVEMNLPEDAELVEGTVISVDVLPSKEGECNVGAARVEIYDGEGFFLVIIDGNQHRIDR